MATYIELRNLMNNSELRNKVVTAVIIAADRVMRGDDINSGEPFSQGPGDHDLRVTWAKTAFKDPDGEAKKFLMSVLASNSNASVSAIENATDIAIQSNVDEAVDLMAGVV